MAQDFGTFLSRYAENGVRVGGECGDSDCQHDAISAKPPALRNDLNMVTSLELRGQGNARARSTLSLQHEAGHADGRRRVGVRYRRLGGRLEGAQAARLRQRFRRGGGFRAAAASSMPIARRWRKRPAHISPWSSSDRCKRNRSMRSRGRFSKLGPLARVRPTTAPCLLIAVGRPPR